MASNGTRARNLHRDFAPAPIDRESPTFTLNGVDFECLPEAPGVALLALYATVDAAIHTKAAAVIEFMRGVLIEEDVPKFDMMVASKSVVIPMETLLEIMNWLAEVYTDRPTLPPSGSPVGRSATGAVSKGN